MYDKATLAKSSGASLGVVSVVGLVFLSTGTAFAVPVAGIGGFTIQADTIEGDDLLLYPGVSETTEAGTHPQAVIEMRNTEIEGLVLTKSLNLADYAGVPLDGTARITIQTDETVTSDQIYLRSPGLRADKATFSGFELSEKRSDDLNEAFSIRAPSGETPETRQIDLDGGSNPGLVMENAKIQTTYLATNQISLSGLQLDVDYDGSAEADDGDDGAAGADDTDREDDTTDKDDNKTDQKDTDARDAEDADHEAAHH